MADSGDLPGFEIRPVELLQAHVIEGDEQGLVPGHVKGVDGAALFNEGPVAAVGIQAVEQAVPLPGGQMIEAALSGHVLAPAAQAAVAAHGVIEAVFLRPQQARLPGLRIHPIGPVVLVQAEALGLGGKEPERLPHGLDPGKAQLLIFAEQPVLSGFPVPGPQGEAHELQLRLADIDGVKNLVAQHRKVQQVPGKIGEGRDGQRLTLYQEKPLTLAVGDASPVMIPGQLVQDLVVLVLLPLLAHPGLFLLIRGIELRAELVHRSGDGKAVLVQHLQLPRGKGQGHKGQGLAAPQVQDVVGGELLVPFRPLFLLGRAHRRKQKPVFVQPGEAPLLAQIRQLAQLPLFIEPEPLLIAVFLLIGIGHNEGRPLPPGGIANIGQEAIVQNIPQFDGFHAEALPFWSLVSL